MSKIKKIHRLFAIILIFGRIFATRTYAMEPLDTTKDVFIEIISKNDDVFLSGQEFEIYKVADIDRYRNPALTADFAAFAHEFAGKEHWQILDYALRMYTHVVTQGLAPLDTGVTGADGKLVFPQNVGLKPALYLTAGKNHIQGDYIYSSEPFLLFVPVYTADGQWDYDTTVSPKYSRQPLADRYTTIQVVKVWQDNGYETARPAEITITLYKDRRIFDAVTLSAANNWRYSWSMLDKTARWTVAETPVDGYTTTVSRENDTYIVTNTYNRPPAPPPPQLPDTGQHWQQPLILFTTGLVLVILGVVRRRTGEYEE